MKRLCMILFLCLLGPAIRAETPLQSALHSADPDLQPLIKSVIHSGSYAENLHACPIDRFPWIGQYGNGTKSCRTSLTYCRALCWLGNGKACFGLARAIEKSGSANHSDFKYPLFLAACAAGNANGCTNAGATAKNGSWIGPRPQNAITFDCQFRTYSASCDAGSAWGCYMLGGTYIRADSGKLYSKDLSVAAYRRACVLKPSSGACLAQYKSEITP